MAGLYWILLRAQCLDSRFYYYYWREEVGHGSSFLYWPWYELVVFFWRCLSLLRTGYCELIVRGRRHSVPETGATRLVVRPRYGGLFKPRSGCLFGLGSVWLFSVFPSLLDMPTEFCAVEWASSPSGGAIPQPLSLVVLLVGQWRIVLWYDPAFARHVNLVMRNVLAGHLAGPFLIWHIWEDWVICSIFTHFYYVGNILSYYHFHYYYYHIIISYWELGLEIKLIIFGNEQVSCGCRLRCSAT